MERPYILGRRCVNQQKKQPQINTHKPSVFTCVHLWLNLKNIDHREISSKITSS